MKKRDILKVIDATLLCAVVAVVITVHGDTAQTETTTHIIAEIPEEVVEARVEVIEEAPVVVEVEEVIEEPCPLEVATFYDVPLSEELQAHIILECKFYGVEPEIVLAMIERESRFQADVMGDNGNAYGLMQIHPRWHSDRMERLGVTDLMNPYQNVTVGIDYLAEMIARGNGIEWAIAAYNAGATGANNGNGMNYALCVMERAEELRGETYVCYE